MTREKYTIDIDTSKEIVHVIAHGKLFKKDGWEIITQARTLAAEHHFNILYDVRKAQIVVSFADWFFLPRELAVFKNFKTRSPQVAVLVSEANNKGAYRFYETVTKNLGIKLKLFFVEELALNWVGTTRLASASQRSPTAASNF